ncbi:uncharacterized protein V1518DRAFT_413339 [Limtongia smithiae]|uniref:uncharacterized protein n=1 Tax=Limtongia smithiae TaxID=1125753 RepID=UPI0034CEA838
MMNILQRTSSSLSFFDIRLYSADRDVIVLRGTPDESAGLVLKGAVVISLIESVSVKKISLRLYGTVRMNWQETIQSPRGLTQRNNRYEKVIYEHTWNFLEFLEGAKNTVHTVGQGNYEYPFEIVLPGSLSESVEGLDGGSVVYKMKAVVERGRFANNLIRKKHIRIVRTLGPEALELSQTMSIENVWPNKVDYSISIPSKAVPIGSATPVHLLLQPLLKGLKLGQIVIVLKEYYTLHIPHGPGHAGVRTVAQIVIPAREVPEDELPEDIWDIKELFKIPPSLTKCTQDCGIPGFIEVRHKLKFAVSLRNPDGHVSELRASLPVSLFISPNVPVNDGTQDIVLQPLNADIENAPPTYNDHIYDRLWEDVTTSGWNTPSASGASTPYARSRRNSGENLEAMGSALSLEQQRAQLQAGLSALALSQTNGDNLPSPAGAPSSLGSDSYFPSRHHSGTVTPLGAMTPLPVPTTDDGSGNPATTPVVGSYGFDRPTNAHVSRGVSPLESPVISSAAGGEEDILNMAMLSRVPSYSTALRNPMPEDVPAGLPSYQDSDNGSTGNTSMLPPRTSRRINSNSNSSSSSRTSSPAAPISRSHSAVQLNGMGGTRSRSHFFDDAARRLKALNK